MLKDRWIRNAYEAAERPKALYTYWVTGRGPFPLDMLRYDRAWPAGVEDAAKVEWTYTDNGRSRHKSIKLYSHQEPTVARWASFVWSVGNEEIIP